MSHEVSSPAAQPAAAPASSGSGVRLLILLALLLLVIGMWYYDYAYAGPGSEQGYEKLQTLITTRNEEAAAKGLVRSEDVQASLGFAPTYTDKQKDYTVEYYCWWGPIPGLNTWKRYVTVLYVGNEPRRFHTHYKNERPHAEDLPGYVPPVDPAAQAAAAAGPAEGASVPDDGRNPPDPAKKKGKGRGGNTPGGEAPAGDAPTPESLPAEKPADADKPAETDKPATDSDKPPEAEKPVEADAPKPADGDAPKPAT
jgi:hypothetical protein